MGSRGRPRSKVYGVGVNDGEKNNNKCPYYLAWKGMLWRCYYENVSEQIPTYRDCYVCEEWLLLSNFTKWMEKQDWKNKELDKDILTPGNKIYSPSTCAFVNRRLNALLTDSAAARGSFPLGVSKEKNKFRARCMNGFGRKVSLGCFTTPELAHAAYVKFKVALIEKYAEEYPELRSGLLAHADKLAKTVLYIYSLSIDYAKGERE